ncbi:Retrovirus-related Pol polyprotein from transposon TNT 1-94 [Araneus ventricosus]|uniref:Retrovirus-related Pol polyprotein from transposon TNT 1-94 n=1 Tax=Araneus ventricosus TaxID=182803 RepID=A0A4Y2AVE7_ARAVE|nr:Retrovirus-related Pol polyprotein from transposon TNT 1-94 [Araneus ventricosus]
MQKEGVDYTETFSPVISMPSLRLVLVLILQENLHSYFMDVKTAFLNGDLDEVVYMSQPQGYDDGTRKVCKLNKSLWSQTSSQIVVSQIPAVYEQSEIQAVYF